MIFQKSRPVETRDECLSSASKGPLKIRMHHPPHENFTPTKCTGSVADKPLWLPASSSVCSLLALFSESSEPSLYGAPALN